MLLNRCQPKKRNTVNNYDHESDNLDEMDQFLKTQFPKVESNPKIYEKSYTLWPNGIYPGYPRLIQHLNH